VWKLQFGLGLAAEPPLVPGEETAAHVQWQSNLAHFVGGAGVGLLCGLATALDMVTTARLGRSFGAVSVLLLTGFITTVYRQVGATFAPFPKGCCSPVFSLVGPPCLQ